MSKRKILLQLDSDPQASVFDGVVAVDAGIDFLFTRHMVTPENVRDLVFGCIFTRGPEDLHQTAIFVGGSDVSAGERLVAEIKKAFFGPMRVSVMVDSNGANTTAAAAVLAVARHLRLADAKALVLGGTGPVGQRVARLLAGQGATVRVASRDLSRARKVVEAITAKTENGNLEPVEAGSPEEASELLSGMNVVIGAGAAGAHLLSVDDRIACGTLKVAIDLNAVPPPGLDGISAMDYGKEHHGAICYGAIGVGRTKMKIHKQAIRELFEKNDRILDAEEIFAIGTQME